MRRRLRLAHNTDDEPRLNLIVGLLVLLAVVLALVCIFQPAVIG